MRRRSATSLASPRIGLRQRAAERLAAAQLAPDQRVAARQQTEAKQPGRPEGRFLAAQARVARGGALAQ